MECDRKVPGISCRVKDQDVFKKALVLFKKALIFFESS